MDALPSTEFRKAFARLTEETLVTVNGHPIAMYVPLSAVEAKAAKLATPPQATVAAQAQRDELLRKINRSK